MNTHLQLAEQAIEQTSFNDLPHATYCTQVAIAHALIAIAQHLTAPAQELLAALPAPMEGWETL